MIRKVIKSSLVILLLGITLPLVLAQENQKSNSNTMKSQSIPVAGFKSADIGYPAIKGIVNIVKDGFDITVGGADVWGVKDENSALHMSKGQAISI